MKAEELMVGDWVCTEHDSTPRQIDWIRTGEVGLLWNKVVTPPYLVPIPLTPEFLEKNGFIIGYDGVYIGRIGHDNNLKMYHKYIGKAHIVVNYLDDGKVGIEISNEFSPKDDKGRADLVTFARDWCNGFCVHELQHALRLCEIEKEIIV